MGSLAEIQEFLNDKKLVIAGASRNPKKFGGVVFGELKKKGYELYPVHPEAVDIGGVKVYTSFSDLPKGIDNFYIVTPAKETAGLVAEAIRYGSKRIWIQQKSETREALSLANEHGIPVITGRCMMMFAEPVGSFHGFHRWLNRLFGSYPK